MGRKPDPPAYRRRRGPKGVFYAVTRAYGKEVYLGKYGTPESYAAFERIVSEWRQAQAKGQQGSLPRLREWPTVADLIARFLVHTEARYVRPDGSIAAEVNNFACAFRPLAKLHGYTLAKDFGPLALKDVRRKMQEANWSRMVINRGVNRIRMLFKWAESEELVPPSTLHALQTVAGLRFGEHEKARASCRCRRPTLPEVCRSSRKSSGRWPSFNS